MSATLVADHVTDQCVNLLLGSDVDLRGAHRSGPGVGLCYSIKRGPVDVDGDHSVATVS
jgi:hypothetical protein